MTAGSDDHSGAYTATAFTKTPLASGVDEYLAFLRRGEHEADGACGGSVLMGHAFYHIAYSYYQDRFVRGNEQRQADARGPALRAAAEDADRGELRLEPEGAGHAVLRLAAIEQAQRNGAAIGGRLPPPVLRPARSSTRPSR